MANTRSGGAHKDGAGDTGAAGTSTRKAGAGAKAKGTKSATTSTSPANVRESRSSSARQASDAQEPNQRRSNREKRGKKFASPATTPVSKKSTRGSGSTGGTLKSAAKKRKGVAESTGKASATRMSNRVKNNGVSASVASYDSSGISSPAATPNRTAKRKIDEQDSVKNTHDGTVSGSMQLKKQKRLSAKSYTKLFRLSSEEKAKSPVPATTLGVDEAKASKVHVEDNGSVLGYEESDAQEQVNQAHLSQVVNKFWEGYTSGSCETPVVILETDGLRADIEKSIPISEAHMPTYLCSQNIVAKSSPAMEAREPNDGYSNKSFVPELPNSPSSTIHSKEAKKAIEDGDPIEHEGACTLNQTEVTQDDETDFNKHICFVCKSTETPGILKSCDGNGCKRKYHLSCLGVPLECVSLGIWLCSICIKERLLFGVYSVSEGVESLLDVKEGVQNCKQYFVKYKNLAHVHNRWVPESDIIDGIPGGHDLLSEFSKKIQKEKTIRWRQEWAEPHRLLKKRSLMPPKEAEQFFNSVSDKLAFCNVEWLIKWKDLGSSMRHVNLRLYPFYVLLRLRSSKGTMRTAMKLQEKLLTLRYTRLSKVHFRNS